MNDIVRMLRVSESDPVQEEAADEIERLRAELAAERELADRLAAENSELKIELAKWVHYWRDKDNKALSEQVAKLREALEEAAICLDGWDIEMASRARAVLAETKGE